MESIRVLFAATAVMAGVSAFGEVPVRPLSPSNANYTIEVRLDPRERMLEGRQTLEWTNITDRATDELRFHLYWNAWRNTRSTWMLEDRMRGRSDRKEAIREEDWSYIDVETVGVSGKNGSRVDLTDLMRFESPDDGNPDDRTVLVVPLPAAVAPGETLRVEMTWRARVPRTFARTGYRGNFYFIAHWFPKLGVFEADGWNCHQYHAATEYFSDYGAYDVSMTVPGEYVLGATGREVERRENTDGTATHRYVQHDVHAFTWTASPDYLVRSRTFERPGLPRVEMRLLFQPEHLGQVERHFHATEAALKFYGTWYGPYPYDHVTVVDPAYGSGAGGMEYPTLFTCGSQLFNPFGGDSPESVTVHEAGHQFWYGLVGNNEFEHAWLDEGLNTFSTIRTLENAYESRRFVQRYLPRPDRSGGRGGFFPLVFEAIEVPRWAGRLDRYRTSATSDLPSDPTFRYFPRTASDITYSKVALWLATLERHLGWDTLQRILSTFFERYRFGHPTPGNFFAVADEVSGQELAWFFDQVYRDSVNFDYAVDSVSSRPAELEGLRVADGTVTYQPAPEDEDDAELYRTEVVVQRRGGGHFPVEVLLVFEDGEEIRESWDGRSRWKLFVEERPSRLDYAIVDPERRLMLDINYTNNSKLREAASDLPAAKWAGKWMIWVQDLLHTLAFFV